MLVQETADTVSALRKQLETPPDCAEFWHSQVSSRLVDFAFLLPHSGRLYLEFYNSFSSQWKQLTQAEIDKIGKEKVENSKRAQQQKSTARRATTSAPSVLAPQLADPLALSGADAFASLRDLQLRVTQLEARDSPAALPVTPRPTLSGPGRLAVVSPTQQLQSSGSKKQAPSPAVLITKRALGRPIPFKVPKTPVVGGGGGIDTKSSPSKSVPLPPSVTPKNASAAPSPGPKERGGQGSVVSPSNKPKSNKRGTSGLKGRGKQN